MTTDIGVAKELGAKSSDTPVFYPEDTRTYFGIVTEPLADAKTTGVVLLSGTFGGTTTLGRNRMWLKMAKALADRGYPVLRFDYAGIGDSAGDAVCYELESPAIPELHAGFDLLASRGVTDYLVVGTCYGSRTALAGSVGRQGVRGVHLLVPPVRTGTKGVGGADHLAEYVGTASLAKRAFSKRILRKLFRSQQARKAAVRVLTQKTRSAVGMKTQPSQQDEESQDRGAAPGFHRPLRQLLSDGVPVRILFGTDDFFWTEFQEARSGRLGEELDRHGDLIDVATVPGTVRGFLSVRVQNLVIDSVVAWAGRLAP
ncbi:MAG: alpha/beta fold hydrolase [Acidimicrobiia bacterium]|nr:alpha/beta fold hydrolase [Acidimicrobiia bacterium]